MEARYYKFICPNCGKGKPATKKEVAIDVGLKSILAILVMFGVFFLIQLVFIGPTDMFNTYLSASFTSAAYGNSQELRGLALNLTSYDGWNSHIFAMDLLANIGDMRYVPTDLYHGMYGPMETLKEGGDCKQMSALFVALMRSSGYKAFIDCSIEHNHCVAKIPYTGNGNFYGGTYMVVDMTDDAFYIYDNSVNHWDNKQDYLEMADYG